MNATHFYRKPQAVNHRILPILMASLFCTLVSMLANAEVSSIDNLNITRVKLIGDNDLHLAQGDKGYMKYRARGRELPSPPFSIKGDTLRLGVDEQDREASKVKFRLSLPHLEALMVLGSGEAYLQPLDMEQFILVLNGSGKIKTDTITAENLTLKLSGSGVIQIKKLTATQAALHLLGSGDLRLDSLYTERVNANLSGSGEIDLNKEGHSESLTVHSLGSGDINLNKLQTTKANVSIVGSGDVEVWATTELNTKTLGSGDILYRGSPKISKTMLGSGDIHQLDQQ
ncbi:MAG: DUF2807 domain-containing protein [Gammaproteobacteria bacterium]|nr:DUF2807 domain-containing protein [Gammaproteobacteria bacterium]